MNDFELRLKGQQLLAQRKIEVANAVTKIFPQADGMRAVLKSGEMSAPFKKISEQLYGMFDRNAFVYNSISSCYVKVKVRIELNGRSHNFDSIIHVGNIDTSTGVFTFVDGHEEIESFCNRILKYTPKELERKQEKIKKLMREIDDIYSSVPYQLKNVIEPRL